MNVDPEANEVSFFTERVEVIAAIISVCKNEADNVFKSQFEYLTLTLSKYQEQPTLLSSSLADMVDPLTQKMLQIVELRGDVVATNDHLHSVCKILHLISRVRGFKHVVKLFPHEVSNLEPCLSLLRTQDRRDYSNWETRYVFLMWLCILCLIPFDICSMDSLLTSNTSTTDMTESGTEQMKSSLVRYIVELCRTYLSDTGPTREAASACLSALLTRPDMETDLLSEFVNSSCSSMNAWAQKGNDVTQELNSDSFNIIGVLHCVSQIFKKGHRSRVLAHAPTVLAPCLLIAAQTNQTLTRKLICKLIQRIGMTFLPPRVATWRYQRGQRSLLQNLKVTDNVSQSDNSSSACDNNSAESDNCDQDEDFEVPDELENIIDHLLCALKDKDTVVRWNSAKGIGRITMRLSKDLADDIVGAVLELFEDKDADSAWHGGCLALAELTRRGLLLPERLTEVVPVIRSAIHFDVLRGQHSVGAHVRDAACYVCWAFARAYSPLVMRPFISELASAMLITALYDREINCRRAASAAFQENVGRQGNENFPFGIEIISIADYFSLGNRSHAYLQIAPSVAMLSDNIRESLTKHLLENTISHWDENIRSLASQALARLSKISTVNGCAVLEKLIASSFSPTIAIRHGSVLGVAEVVHELAANGTAIPAAINDGIVDLVINLDKARMYRGRGGEILRHASCVLIENIARSNLNVDIKKKIALVEFLNENLRQPHEYIQKSASNALRQFLYTYLSSSAGEPSERLQKLTTLKYIQGLSSEENVAATRGYALALGVLPLKLSTQPAGRLKEILDILAISSSPQKMIAGEPDAETRRNCVEASIELTERLTGSCSFNSETVQLCFDILFKACDDHSVDKRGDTGSWSRIAALQGLERLVYACIRAEDSVNRSQIVMTSYGPGILQLTSDEVPERAFVDVKFQICSLGHSFANQISAVDGVKSSTLRHHRDTVTQLQIQGNVESYLSDATMTRIVCAFLEQMAGRLDAVRDIAGNCLNRFMTEGLNDSLTRVPGSELLLSSLSNAATVIALQSQNKSDALNWAHPGHVFPFLAQLFESDIYFHPIIRGFVIAVGGLTESVVKESSAALLKFCRTKITLSQFEPISRLAQSLTGLFTEYSNNDRVILPLLKTLDNLFRNGILDSYRSDINVFATQLLEFVKEESKSSSNVIKIKACVDILIHLLQFEDPIRPNALKAIIIFLGHKYPRIRKHAAESLYVQFLSDCNAVGRSIEDVASLKEQRSPNSNNSSKDMLLCGLARTAADLEKAQDILASTSWDGPMGQAREQRLSLCTLLDLKIQIKTPSEAAVGAKKVVKQAKDELDSYESLVRTAGY